MTLLYVAPPIISHSSESTRFGYSSGILTPLAKAAKQYEAEQPGEQDETVCLGNFVQQSQIGSLELTLVDFVRHLIAHAAGDECRKF